MTDHYTPEKVAIDCLQLVPYLKTDIIMDAGSGKNKVFYNNINSDYKFECEIEEGIDFLKRDMKVDWVVGNPPFDIFWSFLEHSMDISRKGMGFLMSTNCINSMFLPSRLDKVSKAGFGITSIHVINIAKWRGRYFFVIYKKGHEHIISYNKEVYK